MQETKRLTILAFQTWKANKYSQRKSIKNTLDGIPVKYLNSKNTEWLSSGIH